MPFCLWMLDVGSSGPWFPRNNFVGSFHANSPHEFTQHLGFFFVFSGQVDTYKKEKIWKFEVATPFGFCGRTIWNLGGHERKVCREIKDHLCGTIFSKLHPLEPWKSVFWAIFCCRLQKCLNQSHNLLPKQSLRAFKMRQIRSGPYFRGPSSASRGRIS